jgi:hypothetical protein
MSARAKTIREAAFVRQEAMKRSGNGGKGNKVSSGTVDLKYARTVEITSMNTSG